jgi:hypothetical protein
MSKLSAHATTPAFAKSGLTATREKYIEMYKADMFKFRMPPVHCMAWTETDWINWIHSNGTWMESTYDKLVDKLEAGEFEVELPEDDGASLSYGESIKYITDNGVWK